jgi:hypothetical protein
LNPAPEAELAGLLSSSLPAVALDTPVSIEVPIPNLIEEITVIRNYAIAP